MPKLPDWLPPLALLVVLCPIAGILAEFYRRTAYPHLVEGIGVGLALVALSAFIRLINSLLP